MQRSPSGRGRPAPHPRSGGGANPARIEGMRYLGCLHGTPGEGFGHTLASAPVQRPPGPHGGSAMRSPETCMSLEGGREPAAAVLLALPIASEAGGREATAREPGLDLQLELDSGA
jgi:hypothetical protein